MKPEGVYDECGEMTVLDSDLRASLRMRTHLLCLAACGLLPILAHNTYASWMEISLMDQIGFADLIVEGSVVDITDAGFSVGNRNYEAAVVDVTNVLKNTTDMTDIVEARIAQPGSAISGGMTGMAFGASTDIRYMVGQQGTWLLNFDPIQEIFWATHPSQFQVDDISLLVGNDAGNQGSGQSVADSTPEPSTGLMSCIGLLVFVLAGLRRCERTSGQGPIVGSV